MILTPCLCFMIPKSIIGPCLWDTFSLEKLLKAYFVKTHQQHAPFTHNLFRLAEAAGIEVDDEHAEWLFKITAFNLNARYDDYKKEFYTMCSASFALEWIEKIKILQQWIKHKLWK